MSTSDSKVVVDHESDLSSTKEPILFLGFLFLQTDLFLEVRTYGWSCSKQKRFSSPALQNSWNRYPQFYREDFNSTTKSNISTSLIHSKASEGKSEQELTRVLNLIFQHEKRWRWREFIELKLRYLQSLLSSHRILWYFRWQKKIHGWRHRQSSRASKSTFTFRDKSPCTSTHCECTCGTLIRRVKNSLQRCLWWIEHRNVDCQKRSPFPRQIPCIKWHASVAAQERSRTWNDCRLTGNVRKFSTVNRFEIFKVSSIIHAMRPLL